ncbi:MAG: neutral zinc metallopeptidase [Candidatus Saccharimonadales bacterium]
MAMWDKISGGGNVEDRRAVGPGLALGGGLTSIAIVVVIGLLSGQSGTSILQDVLNQASQTGSSQLATDGAGQGLNDGYAQFASKVVGSTNQTWKTRFTALGKTYNEPRLVLFRGATQSACGGATASVGPHYCPTDKTVYLDETFFDALKNQLGGSNGDVAQAYVIAHEVGHNVQNQLGTSEQVSAAEQNGSTDANALSVKLELQADCFAGVWAHDVNEQGVFEPNEVQEALSAAAAVGDDRIQTKTQGRVTPETWTHGSAAQRVQWFNIGLDKGTLEACDTFK